MVINYLNQYYPEMGGLIMELNTIPPQENNIIFMALIGGL